jgi:hypothetical protein
MPEAQSDLNSLKEVLTFPDRFRKSLAGIKCIPSFKYS